MNFKNRFLEALQARRPDPELLQIVHESRTQTFGPREAYQALQAIWMEFGFDERSDGGALQDSLEYVMEKTWYECPADASLT